jgi:hypothetical protein
MEDTKDAKQSCIYSLSFFPFYPLSFFLKKKKKIKADLGIEKNHRKKGISGKEPRYIATP